MTFQVQLNSGPLRNATVVSEASHTYWNLLFSASTRVDPHAFSDWSGTRIRSYPARYVRDLLRNVSRAWSL